MLKTIGQRWCALLLAALLLLGSLPTALAAEGATVNVSSVEELLRAARQCSLDSWSRGRTIVLTADLDLKGESFTPFPIFCGVFDGQGHTISGLRVAESGSSMGLFRILQEGAVVRDLTVAGTVAPSGSACQVGGIVGVNHGAVQNCTFRGVVQGEGQVGGVVGMNRETGQVSGCTAEGQVAGSTATGGIAGQNEGSLLKCSNSAEVNTSSPDASAPPENLDDALEQIGSSEDAAGGESLLPGHTDTGGVVGLSRGVVQSCVNNGTVGYPHVGYNVGGVAGRQSGYLDRCVNNAAVYGRKDVGGIVGQAEPDITILPGAQRLEQLRGELDRLQSLIGQSVTSADAQGDQISDTLSKLGGYAGSAKDSTNILLDQTAAFVDGNIQQVNTLSAAATDALDRLSPALDSLAGTSALIQDMCGSLAEAVDALQTAGSITQEAAALARQALGRLEDAGGELADAAEAMRAAVRRLQDAVIHQDEDAARRALAELASAMTQLSAALAQASDAWAALTDVVHTGIFDIAALRQLRTALAAIGESARQAAQSLLGLSQNTAFNWAALEGGIAAAGAATAGLHSAARLLTDALAALRDAGDTAEGLSAPLTAVRDALLDALDVGGTIGSGLESAFAGMENAVDTLRRNGGVTFVTLGDAFHDASSGLYDAAGGLTKELENLHAGVDIARNQLTGNLQDINQQTSVVANLLLDTITDMQNDGASIVSDSSEADMDSIRQGKIAQCVNNGAVDGDRNVGGVAGAMAVEYGLDPEDDVQRLSLGATYETRAALQANVSRGEITGKKDCVGGTVGRMDLGAVAGCESYGSVTSSGGGYVGGIAGWSESLIRESCAKCVLSGQDNVGGIAGWATRLQDCRAIATIAGGRARLGAIAGSADLEGGGITGNRFVDTGTAGVDGVSYEGMAEPVAFTALRGEPGIPTEFLTFTLRLLVDGQEQARIPFQYGQSLGGIALPEVPEREGFYGRWPAFDTTGLVSDVTVEAVYTPVAALVASGETAEESGPSLALAEGQFTEEAALTVRATSQRSPTGEGEVWKLTLTGTDLPPDAQVPIRLLDRTGGGAVWQYVSGHWQRMDTEKNGQYLLLTMDGLSGVFCVTPPESRQTVLLAAVSAVSSSLVLLLLAAKLVRRRKRKQAEKAGAEEKLP